MLEHNTTLSELVWAVYYYLKVLKKCLFYQADRHFFFLEYRQTTLAIWKKSNLRECGLLVQVISILPYFLYLLWKKEKKIIWKFDLQLLKKNVIYSFIYSFLYGSGDLFVIIKRRWERISKVFFGKGEFHHSSGNSASNNGFVCYISLTHKKTNTQRKEK